MVTMRMSATIHSIFDGARKPDAKDETIAELRAQLEAMRQKMQIADKRASPGGACSRPSGPLAKPPPPRSCVPQPGLRARSFGYAWSPPGDPAVTTGINMPSEQLTYEQLAERLGVTREAARAIVKRHRLPRSKGNDGKILAAVDLDELQHKPMSARSPGGDPAVGPRPSPHSRHASKPSRPSWRPRQRRSAGHRADFERERDRADRMVTTQDRLVVRARGLCARCWEAARQKPCPPGDPPDMARGVALAAGDRVVRYLPAPIFGSPVTSR